MKKKKQKNKKTAIRTCIACGKKSPKQDMVRFVRSSEGEVCIDQTGKLKGRGANLCGNKVCFDRAVKEGRLERALKVEVGEKCIEMLEEKFRVVLEEREFRKGRKKVVLRVKKEKIEDKIGRPVTRQKDS
jgi:hypothetical protein